MTKYVIGTAGQPPRFVVECTAEQAGHFTKDGEVCFAQIDIPPSPHTISADGKALIEATVDPAVELERKWQGVRMRRNAALNLNGWTIANGSPLSADCQSAWLSWVRAMNRVTVDYSDPDAIVWPAEPALAYSN